MCTQLNTRIGFLSRERMQVVLPTLSFVVAFGLNFTNVRGV